MKTLLCTIVLLAVTLFCTTGCEKVQEFTPQHERTDIHLKVKLFDNERELNHYIQSNFEVNKEYKREGFSRWYAQSFGGNA